MLIRKRSVLFISAILLQLLLMSAGWETNFAKAKDEAKASNKHILLSFSGSDWSMASIQISKEIFGNTTFMQFADTNLVLVNVDFPKLKKNYLGKELTVCSQTKVDLLLDSVS